MSMNKYYPWQFYRIFPRSYDLDDEKMYSGLPVTCQAHLQGTRPEAMQQFNASAVSKWIYYTLKKTKNFGTA